MYGMRPVIHLGRGIESEGMQLTKKDFFLAAPMKMEMQTTLGVLL